jgi:hypothetical protein
MNETGIKKIYKSCHSKYDGNHCTVPLKNLFSLFFPFSLYLPLSFVCHFVCFPFPTTVFLNLGSTTGLFYIEFSDFFSCFYPPYIFLLQFRVRSHACFSRRLFTFYFRFFRLLPYKLNIVHLNRL